MTGSYCWSILRYFLSLLSSQDSLSDGEHQFLDLDEKLSKLAKYAPHLWKDDVSLCVKFEANNEENNLRVSDGLVKNELSNYC